MPSRKRIEEEKRITQINNEIERINKSIVSEGLQRRIKKIEPLKIARSDRGSAREVKIQNKLEEIEDRSNLLSKLKKDQSFADSTSLDPRRITELENEVSCQSNKISELFHVVNELSSEIDFLRQSLRKAEKKISTLERDHIQALLTGDLNSSDDLIEQSDFSERLAIYKEAEIPPALTVRQIENGVHKSYESEDMFLQTSYLFLWRYTDYHKMQEDQHPNNLLPPDPRLLPFISWLACGEFLGLKALKSFCRTDFPLIPGEERKIEFASLIYERIEDSLNSTPYCFGDQDIKQGASLWWGQMDLTPYRKEKAFKDPSSHDYFESEWLVKNKNISSEEFQTAAVNIQQILTLWRQLFPGTPNYSQESIQEALIQFYATLSECSVSL